MKKSKLISLWGGANLLIALLIFFLLLSCSKEESVEKNNKIEDNEVSINQAISIANKFSLTKTFSKEIKSSINFHKSGIKRIVKQVFELKDNNGDIAIYAITFDPIGFVLISATKKEFPILAHSSINKLDLINQPKGLNKWLNFRILRIKELNESQLKIPDYINREWESYYGHPDWEDPNEGDPDPPTSTSVGPIMNITWGQGRFYNSLLPDMGCSQEDLGGKPPVGCVAVAMGQIMKHHAFPNNYNWTSMPSFGPNADVRILLKDIGQAVNMSYSCNASSASTKYEAASSLINDFGYSSTATFIETYNDNTRELIKQEIDADRPVIMKGGEFDSIFGYINGHAWVCEGYDVGPNDDYLKFYMNWGDDGTSNAWFSYNDFNFTDSYGYSTTHNYHVGVVIGIKP